MNTDDPITISAVTHSDPLVQRTGFDLDHPYVVECWTPILGPSATLLLHRLPQLWRDHGDRLHVDSGELGAMIGKSSQSDRRGVRPVLDRLARFHRANWKGDGELEVPVVVPPVPLAQLDRLPDFARQRHDQLLGSHLDDLASQATRVVDLNERIDRLTKPVPSLQRPVLSR